MRVSAAICVLLVICLIGFGCSSGPQDAERNPLSFQHHVIDSGDVVDLWLKVVADMNGDRNLNLCGGNWRGTAVDLFEKVRE